MCRSRQQRYSSLSRYKYIVVPIATLLAPIVAGLTFVVINYANTLAFPHLFATRPGSIEDLIAIFRDHPLSAAAANVIGIVAWLAIPATLLAFALGSRRLIQRRADDLVRSGQYRPVVFLRSFQDEGIRVSPKSLLRWLVYARPTLEQVVLRTVGRLGPAIAIGLPGERLPRLGAMRAYYSDESWQAAFAEWVERSDLIVVMVGSTPWALWEINYLLAHGHAAKLLLVIPPPRDPADGEVRGKGLREAAQGTPWAAALGAIAPQGGRAMTLLPQGEVKAVASRMARQVDYELAVQIARLEHART